MPTGPNLPGIVLAATLLTPLLGLALGLARWQRGTGELGVSLRGLAAIPRRYLVDVHNVVMHDKAAARMHVLAAGGFVAMLATLVVHHFVIRSAVLAWVIAVACFMLLAGAALVLRQRRPKPARLSGGAWNRLGFGLAALAVFFGSSALADAGALPPIDHFGAGLPFALLGLYGWAEIAAGMVRGPMRHAIYGALHLACHPRPERFAESGQPTALRPLDLDRERLGVGRLADFSARQLLSFDACVQCGRCETVCPAFDAGAPLNPKALVQDFAGASGSFLGSSYQGSPHPGLMPAGGTGPGFDGPLIGPEGAVAPETIWACTTCRACVDACPMLIEHVDAVVDIRRFLILEQGAGVGKAAETLDNIRLTESRLGVAPDQRLDWAADLRLRVLGEGESCDVLLWLGGSALEVRSQRTLRALVALLRAAEVDLAVLGPEERDSGDLARRLGDEATFQDLAHRNIETLRARRFARIVTADPHDLHTLRNEYPAFGGVFEVRHHTELLLELVEAGRLRPGALPELSVAYHDPCYLARYNGITEAPRALLAALGASVRDMDRSGLRTHCCGGGGAAPITDIASRERIADRRMNQVRQTGATTLAVACPGCLSMLEGVVGPKPVVKDVAELLLAAVEDAR